jgi:DNA-binding MarR family transcriptional regulator
MQVIRAEIRRQRGRDLSILQLRALAFLNRHPGVTLSAVAEHVGLTLSSMSTQITKLVQRKLVQREESPHDRRYVTLTLTTAGLTALETARSRARANLAIRCEQLSAEERVEVMQMLQLLRSLFSSPASTIETEK